MGSVTPLLAVVEAMRLVEPTAEFFWVGTKDGPESKLVAEYNIPFVAIASGKLRRYWSWQNFIDPFKIVVGLVESLFLLRKIRPQIILSAGGFVSVPVVWIGWLLKIPAIIHQQDIIPGLANKLMAGRAKKITTTFERSLKYFSPSKTVYLGNPVRLSVLTGNRESAAKTFSLEPEVPVVLVIGGGTGALALNQAVVDGLPQLLKFCQIIHVTGTSKNLVTAGELPRYHHYEFLTSEMKEALAAADIVISRAGLGFLTELAALGKAVILVPLPGTHQEANAAYFARNNAVLSLSQEELTGENLTSVIKSLLDNKSDKVNLEKNIRTVMKWGAEKEMVKIIMELTSKG